MSSDAQALNKIAEKDPRLFSKVGEGKKSVTAARRQITMAKVKETLGSAPLPATPMMPANLA